MAIKFANPLKIGGYVRVERRFEQFHPLWDWIVIEEELERTAAAGRLFIPDKDHTKTGLVLKLGDRAAAKTGIQPGDRVVYTEWSGGRWSFPDPEREAGVLKVLIMECDDVQSIIRTCDHETGCDCAGFTLPESATLSAI